MTEEKTLYSPADVVIYLFGGVNNTAELLEVSGSTVSRWRDSHHTQGKIPPRYYDEILAIAEHNKIKLTYEDLVKGRMMKPVKELARRKTRSDRTKPLLVDTRPE